MINGLSTVNDHSVVKKQTADNLVGEDSTTDVLVEVMFQWRILPVEDSTIDIPKKDLATSTREEQTTADGKAKASGKGGRSGSKWKDHLRQRRKKGGR